MSDTLKRRIAALERDCPASSEPVTDGWEPVPIENLSEAYKVVTDQFELSLYHLWADRHWTPDLYPAGGWHRLTMLKDLALLNLLNLGRDRLGAPPLDHAALWGTVHTEEKLAIVQDCLEALEPEEWHRVFALLKADLLEKGFRYNDHPESPAEGPTGAP